MATNRTNDSAVRIYTSERRNLWGTIFYAVSVRAVIKIEFDRDIFVMLFYCD